MLAKHKVAGSTPVTRSLGKGPDPLRAFASLDWFRCLEAKRKVGQSELDTTPAVGEELERSMYVAEILEHCRNLAGRTAQVYRRLAQRFHGHPQRADLWREL